LDVIMQAMERVMILMQPRRYLKINRILRLHLYSSLHSFTAKTVLHLLIQRYVLTMRNQENKLAALNCVR